MKFVPSLRTATTVAGLGLVAMALMAGVASAQDAAAAAPTPPVPNKGDTAWLLISSALVLMMSIPGLALFYGGLVRTKNMLSVLTQVMAIVALVGVVWVVYGYSLSFTEGSGSLNPFVGGFSRAFLMGMTPDSTAATFSNGVVVPELAYMVFQMTFAMITPALIVGAFAERMKFSAVLLFVLFWVTLIYFPIAHSVWYWAGPDAIADAAKALAAATDDAAKKAAQDALDAVNANAGYNFQAGALDFAGGTVVHINAGIAGLVGAYVLGKRVGYGKEAMAPHNLTFTMVGASLLWVGWFGFNAGSALEAGDTASLAFVTTLIATATAVLAWTAGEWMTKGKPSMLGAASGAVAGLVAITPACGFVGVGGALIIGALAGFVCLWGVNGLKRMLGADDALDVFGVHATGGILGAMLTGVFAAPSLGGQGIYDYVANKTSMDYSIVDQLITQGTGVLTTLVWSGVVAFIAFKLVDLTIGLRVTEEEEREGLDISSHGESAYRM